MSWEMATARVLISSRVQILWVIARVQEGKTLLGYQIVAILCLKEKGGKKKKNHKKPDYFFGVKHAIILMLLTCISKAMPGIKEGLEQVHLNTEDIEEN